MKARFLLTLLLSVLPMAAMAGEDVTETILDAPINAVAVYSDRAQITRTAKLDMKAGEHALLIENLPEAAIDASFCAVGKAGITLLGLSLRVVQHMESPQGKVAELERCISELSTGEHRRVGDRIAVLNSQKKLLTSLADSTGKTIAEQEPADASVGARLLEVNDSLRLARIELTDIQNRVQKLRRELSELRPAGEANSSKTVQIDLSLKRDGNTEIILEYVIPGAGWEPLYDARLSDDGNEVELTYFAEVTQNTGEDWSDVDLTLATAAASKGAGPCSLTPNCLSVRQTHGQIKGRIIDAETGEPISGASVSIVGTRLGAATDFDGLYVISRLTPGVYELRISHLEYIKVNISDVTVYVNNKTPVSFAMTRRVADLDKTIIVLETPDVLDRYKVAPRLDTTKDELERRPPQTVDELLQQVAGARTAGPGEVHVRGRHLPTNSHQIEGVPPDGTGAGSKPATSNKNVGSFTTVFDIAGKTSVPSGEEAVRVIVSKHTMDSKTRLVARPSDRECVHRGVTLSNQDKAPLMPGKVSLFAGPDFLGNTQLRTMISPSQEFGLPFGLDSNVTVSRETRFYNKSSRGDTTLIEQIIRLTITNHASSPRSITLEEAFPVNRDHRIKIKTGDMSPQPDQIYEFGLATWNLTLAPSEEVVVFVPYHIEYPQGLEVIGM